MTDDVIRIESTRDPHDMGTACLLRWGAEEKYAPVADVRQTAEDLFTCAAYADMISELLRIGLPPEIIGKMATAMLADRQPRHFGGPTTLYVLPAGSSEQKQGVVLLGRRNEFHCGRTDSYLTPVEARTMGRAWLAAAEASDADTLFGAVLERSGWMADTELNALFGLIMDIREGKAEVPPRLTGGE